MPRLMKNSGLSDISPEYSDEKGSRAWLNSMKLMRPRQLWSCLAKNSITSSSQNSVNPKFLWRPSIRSRGLIWLYCLMSNMRNASFMLKSDFKAKSILADSTSLSRNTISFKIFISSAYSHLFIVMGGRQRTGSIFFSEKDRFKGEQGLL